jgi:hypothetical protein
VTASQLLLENQRSLGRWLIYSHLARPPIVKALPDLGQHGASMTYESWNC